MHVGRHVHVVSGHPEQPARRDYQRPILHNGSVDGETTTAAKLGGGALIEPLQQQLVVHAAGGVALVCTDEHHAILRREREPLLCVLPHDLAHLCLVDIIEFGQCEHCVQGHEAVPSADARVDGSQTVP